LSLPGFVDNRALCYNAGVMTKAVRVCKALDERYGKKRWDGYEPILDCLVWTVLSQNTSASNCNEAFARLRERFCSWQEVKDAAWQDIADAIRPGGLANLKAPRIKNILEQVKRDTGKLDLDWIADLPAQQARDYLEGFDGVGRKTAACVLMFGLGKPVMPVDTHVHRISKRLGLIGDVAPDAAHDILQRIVPPERIYSCHVNMVVHGREVCGAARPRCEECNLTIECDYFAERFADTTETR